MKIPLPLILVALLFMAGCSSTKISAVMPMEQGMYKVRATSDDKADAIDATVKAAKKTCESERMRPVIVEDQSKYSGLFGEESAKYINKAVGVAKKFINVIPGVSSDKDYEATLRFKCEK